MPDKTLKCVECGNEFNFSEGEQQFYQEKGFQEPKRCKDCRNKAKARRQEHEVKAEEKPAVEDKAE